MATSFRKMVCAALLCCTAMGILAGSPTARATSPETGSIVLADGEVFHWYVMWRPYSGGGWLGKVYTGYGDAGWHEARREFNKHAPYFETQIGHD
jgi:hypothetical protein